MATISLVQQPAIKINISQQLGALALLGFVYAFLSRLLDVRFHFLHLPLLLGTFTFLSAVVSGNLFAGLKTRIGTLYVTLTILFVLGTPFSVWRGGSVGVLKDWIRAMLVWMFLVGLITTWRESARLLNTIVYSSVTAAMLGLIGGTASQEGRLVMDHGRFGNPNDLALVLLIGLPLVWRYYAEAGSAAILRKAFAIGAGLIIMMAFLKSGSRGGLFSFLFGCVLVFIRVPLKNKLLLAICGTVLFLGAFAALPPYLRERYFTLSSDDTGGEGLNFTSKVAGAAAASTENREELLKASIMTTLTHPVFGVGLGNFSVYQFDLSKELGRKADWLGTHNTYTQLSSEAGIPALILLVSILVLSWRSLTRVIQLSKGDPRPLAREINRSAHAMQVCFGTFCFFLFFYHASYDIIVHLMVAVVMVVVHAARQELVELGLAPAAYAVANPNPELIEPPLRPVGSSLAGRLKPRRVARG